MAPPNFDPSVYQELSTVIRNVEDENMQNFLIKVMAQFCIVQVISITIACLIGAKTVVGTIWYHELGAIVCFLVFVIIIGIISIMLSAKPSALKCIRSNAGA